MEPFTLLFLCTGNACRSQIAEGYARALIAESNVALHINVLSAGLEAHGLNPRAVEVMAEDGINIADQTSDVLTQAMLDQADRVITLCGHADEHCPMLPPHLSKRHWPLEDPAQAKGSEAEIATAFRSCREEVKSRMVPLVKELISAPPLGEDSQFDAGDLALVKREVSYKGFFEIQNLHIKHRLFRGGWSQVFVRELFARGQAVVVLLYDPQRDQVVLVEQFRVGALESERSPWLLELVAGLVEPGESLEDVARREAEEEAGCSIQDLERICSYWVSPGGTNERVTIFCGRVDAEGVGGIHGLAHENEDIRVAVVAREIAYQQVCSGRIDNAATIMALQWLELNRDCLQEKWSNR